MALEFENGDNYYPAIIDVLSAFFTLTSDEESRLHGEWSDGVWEDDFSPSYSDQVSDQYRKASELYEHLVNEGVLMALDPYDRMFVLLLARRLALRAYDELQLQAFSVLLVAADERSRSLIKDLHNEMSLLSEDLESLAALYVLDFVITGSDWGKTHSIFSDSDEDNLLPRISRQQQAALLKLVYDQLGFLREYGEMVEIDIDPYPDSLLVD